MRTWQRPFFDLERVFYRAIELLGHRLDPGNSSDSQEVDDPLASPIDRVRTEL